MYSISVKGVFNFFHPTWNKSLNIKISFKKSNISNHWGKSSYIFRYILFFVFFGYPGFLSLSLIKGFLPMKGATAVLRSYASGRTTLLKKLFSLGCLKKILSKNFFLRMFTFLFPSYHPNFFSTSLHKEIIIFISIIDPSEIVFKKFWEPNIYI